MKPVLLALFHLARLAEDLDAEFWNYRFADRLSLASGRF
jgi:hypothetical protein